MSSLVSTSTLSTILLVRQLLSNGQLLLFLQLHVLPFASLSEFVMFLLRLLIICHIILATITNFDIITIHHNTRSTKR